MSETKGLRQLRQSQPPRPGKLRDPPDMPHGSRALSKTEQSYAIQQGKAAYVRWELSKQGAKSVEATQAPMTVQDAPDTEMTGAENHIPTVTEPQPSTVEEGSTSNSEEPDLSEGSMDTDGEVAEEEEESGEEEEDEKIEETIPLPPLPPLPPLTQPATEQNTTSQPKTARITSIITAKQSTVKAAVLRRMQPEQLTVLQTRDLLWVIVNGVTILNVYNDPQVTETITAITKWNVPTNTIVAGDMNAHHLHWRTDRPNSRCGTQLAEWAEEQGLLLLNEPDTDTTRARPQRRPTTIDLAFSNIDQASAVVEEYLTTGSLHYTACIEVLAAEIPQRVISRYKVSLDEEMEDFVAQVKTAVSSLQPSLDSHENIEQTTTALSNIIETAIRTCGHRQNNHKAGKNPWWNKECADALLEYRVLWRTTQSLTGQETQHARICFKRIVRRV
ncbi:hypothetical protein NHJ6243_008964 [Beauveria neobassiana]